MVLGGFRWVICMKYMETYVQTSAPSNAICAESNTIITDYADRLMSIERARQLAIARSIARLYADVLKEPIPTDIERLVRHVDPGHDGNVNR
jgi:hypothetical protein